MENPFSQPIEQKADKGLFNLAKIDLKKIAELNEQESFGVKEPYTYHFREVLSGKEMDGLVTIQRFYYDPEATFAPMHKAGLEIEYTDPQTKDRIAKFGGSLVRGWMDYNRRYTKSTPERGNKDFWTVYYRRVDESARRKGVGSLLLDRFEEVARMLKSVPPFENAEWIQMTTGLASLSKLLLNRGFVIHPADAAYLERVIDNGAVELKDIPRDQSDIMFIKDL